MYCFKYSSCSTQAAVCSLLNPTIINFQVFADGYVPRELEFMVVEQHPTLLNVTMHPAKVGQRGYNGGSTRRRQRPYESPPWLGGSGGGSGGVLGC